MYKLFMLAILTDSVKADYMNIVDGRYDFSNIDGTYKTTEIKRMVSVIRLSGGIDKMITTINNCRERGIDRKDLTSALSLYQSVFPDCK